MSRDAAESAVTIAASAQSPGVHVAFGRLDNARGPRVSVPIAGKHADRTRSLSRAIILPPLDMAVIGEKHEGLCSPRTFRAVYSIECWADRNDRVNTI